MSFVLVIRFSNYVIGQSSVYNSNVDAWSEVVGTRMKNPGWLNQMHPVGEFHICGFHIFSRNSEIPRPSQSERTCQDPVQGRKRILREEVQSDDGKRWFISLRGYCFQELLVLVLKVPVCVTLPCHELCREKQIEWERVERIRFL